MRKSAVKFFLLLLLLFNRPLHALEESQSDDILKGLAEGNYALVVNTLEELNAQVELGTLPQPLYFLMGIIAYKEGRFDVALEHLKKAHDESYTLKTYVTYWIGKTYNAQNHPDEALAWLNVPAKISRQIDEDIFWERIESLLLLGRLNEVSTFLTRRSKDTKADELEQFKIQFYQSKIAAVQHNKALAHKIWKEFLTNQPLHPYETEILSLLKKEKRSINDFLTTNDWLKRASTLSETGYPREALEILERINQKGKDLSFEIACAVFKGRDYRRAAQLLQALCDFPKPGQNRAEILSMLAASYGRSDQFDEALRINQEILRLYPHSNMSKIARYKIAFIYLDKGQYAQAVTEFDDYLAQNLAYKKKEALWNRIWSLYLTKNYHRTMGELEALEKKESDKNEQIRITYWKARCLEEMNNSSSARRLLAQIIAAKPNHYYAFLAKQKLKNGKLIFPDLVEKATIDHLPHAVAEAPNDEWMRSIPLTDPLVEAIQLARIGLAEYAYDAAERSTLTETGLSFPIFRKALEAAQNFKRISAIGRVYLRVHGETVKDPLIWMMSYPKAYPQWISVFTQKYTLDPNLAWSVMREESSFRPTVISPAQAIGLMQMIPQTGKEVATLLGKNDFHPENLKDPMTNMEFGTFYLKNRLDEFEGNIVYALASYNAGPEAVQRWRKWGDKLAPDEFIELIPYDETRGYVKKVMTSYWIYRKLYE